MILHDDVPVLYQYWLILVRKDKVGLRFSHIPAWIVYPALHLVYSLSRGALTGIYLYHFINVNALC